MPSAVSIVIPVYNGSQYLAACLDSVAKLSPAPLECIVVDDGSTDDSAQLAGRAGVRVLSTGGRRGPAFARNAGARAAGGEILLFVDADVLLPADAVARVLMRLGEDPGRDAVIGSYDDTPGSPNFVSQYRNLLHAYTHQNGQAETCTFWTGCGAIRKRVFMDHGGFSEVHARPYLEDVELGLRLRQAGRRIWLDKGLRVTHLKRLSLAHTLRTDLLDRAVPWTGLILRYRAMPADLNLRWEQRFSVPLALWLAAAVAGGGLSAAAGAESWLYAAASGAVPAALLATLNRRFYGFLTARRSAWFTLRAFPLHCLYFLCSGLGFVMGVARYVYRSRVPELLGQRVSARLDW
jgi:cellulose synthase/poly-beta-1,6-N-acetylglucosamine synthase-like glycosyltransferase